MPNITYPELRVSMENGRRISPPKLVITEASSDSENDSDGNEDDNDDDYEDDFDDNDNDNDIYVPGIKHEAYRKSKNTEARLRNELPYLADIRTAYKFIDTMTKYYDLANKEFPLKTPESLQVSKLIVTKSLMNPRADDPKDPMWIIIPHATIKTTKAGSTVIFTYPTVKQIALSFLARKNNNYIDYAWSARFLEATEQESLLPEIARQYEYFKGLLQTFRDPYDYDVRYYAEYEAQRKEKLKEWNKKIFDKLNDYEREIMNRDAFSMSSLEKLNVLKKKIYSLPPNKWDKYRYLN